MSQRFCHLILPLKIIYLKILVFLENIPHPFKQSVKLSANISTNKAMKGNRSISDWFLFNFNCNHYQNQAFPRSSCQKQGWQLLTMWQYLDNYIKQLLKLLVSIGMHILPTILFTIFLWRCSVKQSWAFSLDNNFLSSYDLNCLMLANLELYSSHSFMQSKLYIQKKIPWISSTWP